MTITPDQLRAQLRRLGLSQVGAAKRLNITDRTMRRYCAGKNVVPPRVAQALDDLEAQGVVTK